ncbi:protein kinase [bacterium]|nr:protein kinase [bacterium]
MQPNRPRLSDTELELPKDDPAATIYPEGSLRSLLSRALASGVESASAEMLATTPRPDPGEDQTRPMAPDEIPVSWGATGYVVGRQIGQGGMGEVFTAHQNALQRTVALKTIRQENWMAALSESPGGMEALRAEFVREALIAARLEHPNITPVHDLTFTGPNQRPNLVMKLIRGVSWSLMLFTDRRNMTAVEFLAKHLPILERMAQAVAFAHSRGIMHRDLKPGQVMVGEFGETMLMDWGLALQFAVAPDTPVNPEQTADVPTLETASNPAGTPCMMAPEQTTNDPSGLGRHTDIYLLGGTLYHILTGSYPHEAPTSNAAMMRAATGEVIPPDLRAPGRWIPVQLAELAMKAMAPRPEDRLASAEDFIAGIRDYLTGASRRRESEALTERAQVLMDESIGLTQTADLYARRSEISEVLGRALELWPDSPAAMELKARNLSERIKGECKAGDLQLAAMHLEELRAQTETHPSLPVDIKLLGAEYNRAEARRRTQHRQRSLFAWAATILLVGHAAGMTFWLVRSRGFVEELQQQRVEMARRSDEEARALHLEAGDLLLAANRPEEAMQHFARAMALSQLIDGAASASAQSAASKLAEATRLAANDPRREPSE